jgi:hypothetical protein
MSFNWAEYLSIAEALCGIPVSGPVAGTEAQQRAGVSRAYYAGFVSARNRLRDADGVAIPAGANPHRFVAHQYKGDPTHGGLKSVSSSIASEPHATDATTMTSWFN